MYPPEKSWPQPSLPFNLPPNSWVKNLEPPMILHLLSSGASSSDLRRVGPFSSHRSGLSLSPSASMSAYSITLWKVALKSHPVFCYLPPLASCNEPILFICLVAICFLHLKGISGRERTLSGFCLSRCSVPVCGVKQNYNHERILVMWIFAATKQKNSNPMKGLGSDQGDTGWKVHK